MKVSIELPSSLRPLAGGASTLELEADTAGAALAALRARHPALGPRLFADDGTLRRFINVYVDGEDIRHLAGYATPLREGAVLVIVPAVAGG